MDRESGRPPATEGRTRRCAEIVRAPGGPVRSGIHPHLADNRCSAVGACRRPGMRRLLASVPRCLLRGTKGV